MYNHIHADHLGKSCRWVKAITNLFKRFLDNGTLGYISALIIWQYMGRLTLLSSAYLGNPI
jgi:hypothetical protein